MHCRIKSFFASALLLTFGGHYCCAELAEGEDGVAHEEASFEGASLWTVTGRLTFDYRIPQKPSGQAGISVFQLPWMSLQVDGFLDESSRLIGEVIAESPSAAASIVRLRQLSYQLHEDVDWPILEVGLFPSAFYRRLDHFWPWRRLASEFDHPFQRWTYLADSDYGLGVFKENPQWSWGFQVTNGEGVNQSETGPHKEFSLWAIREWGSVHEREWLLGMQVIRGGYENVGTNAFKDRATVSLWMQEPAGLSAHLEYNYASDTVDAINGAVANQVDLTPYSGQRMAAIGYGGHLSFAWLEGFNRTWGLFIRGDRWEPVKGAGSRAIDSSHFGLTLQTRRQATWAFYNTQTTFAHEHSKAARDQQSWRFALDLRLD